MNARSAPSSDSSASAWRAASRNRLYCAGSSGFVFGLLCSGIFRPFDCCYAWIYFIFTRRTTPYRWSAIFQSPVLESYYFPILVAICACPMRYFGAAFWFFQYISKSNKSDIPSLIAGFIALPSFKLSHAFFKCAYFLQQRRLSRIGGKSALLGGEDLSLQFPESIPKFDKVADLYQFLDALARRTQGECDGV